MATLLEIQNAEKRYGDQLLMDDASVGLPEGCKIGLVGRNGAGKSTLCRILVGTEELDHGTVTRHPRLRLGYLRQHDPFQSGETVMDFLVRDSDQLAWRCGEVAARFHIKGDQLLQPVAELSGGWQTRVKLTALLLHDPNLLILDEPTNFLDVRTQILLENFLKEFRGACLVVSHDRTFLKDTCTHTLELARGKLTLFPGDIETYIAHRSERQEHDARVNTATRLKQKQLKRFIDKNRANANTASQARNKQKQLDRLELLESASPERTVRIRVPAGTVRRGTAVRCHHLAIGYPDHDVASEIGVEIEHGTRTAVVGDNGQGKTTFLRTLVESLPALAGELQWGYGCLIGTYAQHVYTTLPPKQTVRDYLEDCKSPETTSQVVQDIAGSFLFHGELIEKKIAVLSGGERARLCLAGLLLAPHNVLVLDEPVNHLDVETVDALAEALTEYAGTVIFTSHDRHFVGRIATDVIEVRAGRAVHYQGNYEAYLYRVEREFQADGDSASLPATDRPATAPNVEDRKAAGQSLRARRKEIAAIERKIARLDDQRKELKEQLLIETDAAQAQDLHEKIVAIEEELTPAETRWLELQEDECVS